MELFAILIVTSSSLRGKHPQNTVYPCRIFLQKLTLKASYFALHPIQVILYLKLDFKNVNFFKLGLFEIIFVQQIINQIVMKLFYGILVINMKAFKSFLEELPAASSNAIHR